MTVDNFRKSLTERIRYQSITPTAMDAAIEISNAERDLIILFGQKIDYLNTNLQEVKKPAFYS